jgi:hypothetical protein
VLRIVKLVYHERRVRKRFYKVDPARLVEVSEWLKPFEHSWRERLQTLDDTLNEENSGWNLE